MTVHYDIAALPVFRNAVLTIGTFDGVHTGHMQIISQMISEAAAVKGETVIVTFDPHPRKIVGKSSKTISLLSTLAEKIGLLEKAGIDHLVVVPFTADFAAMSATAYVEDFLVSKFHPHTLIIGYDHQFGQGRQGNFQLLEQYAIRHFFSLIEIPGHLVSEAAVSSTRIRSNIQQCNISDANALLGYPYFFEARVIEGNRLGRTIGYPTANLEPTEPEKLIPGNGVYAVTVHTSSDATPYQGMMNIGVRPTIGGTSRVIEVNIFNFGREIYNEIISIHVRGFIRAEQKFSGLDALKSQLASDKLASEQLLAGN